MTIFYITWVIILLIRLIEEWRYYNSYNAPLASAIFIVLPSLIAIGGSIIADIASIGDEGLLQTSLANINLNLDILNIESFYLYFNIFGLIFALPFFIILLILLRRYYSGRYPSIFVFRKKLSSDTLILYNCTMLLILGYFWIDRRTVELSGLSFIIISYTFFIQYYLLNVVLVPLRRVSNLGRNNFRRITSTNTNSQSASPTISWTNHSSSLARSRPSTRITSSNQGSISIAPAINASPARAVKKLSPAVIASLTPVGQHLTNDDFRCIFCYEFPTEANRRVVICPHCKHPAHANEFQKWLAVANICSRCNKPIANAKMIRLSGTNYEKIIRMFHKN